MTTSYAVHEHHDFMPASREAVAEPNLQLALARLTGTLAANNQAAFAALVGSDLLREKARQIKDEALAHLDEHLETLEQAVVGRGGVVHWAEDAEAARRIIVEIAKERGVRRVVKSKSMTAEEVHLNPALEAAGIEVTETDFGEYILQVAGERPSHLVAPVVHKTKEQIAELLSRASGESLPADAWALAKYARRTLREKFRQAEMGITGGNFVVAETGTLVLVTNEGNARLTTAMPRIHVALVGIEKVIPRLADLPVFLKLLARAATGQKLSVYTSILTGPRRAGEVDGPEEFHLVLLDHGRTRILAGPLRESLFCIRCGACLNVCPVYRKVGGHAYGGVYAGPIGAVITPLYDGVKANHHLPHASSLCGACQAACPLKISIPHMLIALRSMLNQQAGSPLGERLVYRLWTMALRRAWTYRLAVRLSGGVLRLAMFFSKRLGGDGWLRKLPGPLAGWTDTRDFPAPAAVPFHRLWRRLGDEDASRDGHNR